MSNTILLPFQPDAMTPVQLAAVSRHLGEMGLMPSSINTMMHDVRGFFRFLQVAQTVTVHHGALAYLLGIKGPKGLRRSCGGVEN